MIKILLAAVLAACLGTHQLPATNNPPDGVLCQEQAPPVAAASSAEQVLVTALTQKVHDLEINLQRAECQAKLAHHLMKRLVEPIDRWLDNDAITKEPLPSSDGPKMWKDPRWYMLLIRSENQYLNDDIWIKFSLDPDERKTVEYGEGSPGYEVEVEGGIVKETMLSYAKRKRDSLFQALEKHLINLLENTEARETMVDGTPHVYRLATQDSPPDKVRKEDIIY